MFLKELNNLKEAFTAVSGDEYEDSSYFDDDVEKLSTAFDNILTILKSSEFQNWMKSTDDNFGTKKSSFALRAAGLLDTVSKAEKGFDALYGDLVKISE